MPKNKTHSGASKRFQVTGTGKICARRRACATTWRRSPRRSPVALSGTAEVAKTDVPRAKKLLGL